MIKRIYVEKQPPYATAEKNLLLDIQNTLKIKGLEQIRRLHRYDVEGMEEEAYRDCCQSVFSEPSVDYIYQEDLPENFPQKTLAVEYLPGQYDMRAESAVQCIQLRYPGQQPMVRYATVYGFVGNLSEEEINRIKAYLINPVDSREAQREKPKTLKPILRPPQPVPVLDGFCCARDEERNRWMTQLGLSMDLEDFCHIQEYFRNTEKRDPTMTEIKVLDTYWSDHCRHTTFHTHLTEVDFEKSPYGQMVQEAFDEYLEMRKAVYGHGTRPVSLMDMACLGTKYLKQKGLVQDLDESEEINACSIRRTVTVDGEQEDWLIQFKNETHNHPTEIEPYGGAATCLGGAIRDPLAGRAYIYQAMRVTGSGDPRKPVNQTLPGKLPQKKITQEAALGYSSYGNQIGVATGLVDEIYHEGYVAKRMEVGAVIGATPASHVVRKKPQPGDCILLLGGKTGRDGCGGATGSSKKHTEKSMETAGAEVQKGNPPVERDLQRLFRRKEVAQRIKRCNDFGAGGVSVAIGELAPGLFIDLDRVPKKYEGLDGTELAISESQERMAVVVAKEDEKKMIDYANEENLQATTIARVTDNQRMIMVWKGKEIFNIQRDFLDTNGVLKKQKVRVVSPVKAKKDINQEKGTKRLRKEMETALEDINLASKKGLVQQFDSTIGAATILMPYGGTFQRSPEMGMVAKIPLVRGETQTATAMTYGGDPQLMEENPFLGAILAVVDSATKMVALGANLEGIRLSFQEYFKKMTHPKDWGQPLAALLGGLKAQKELGIPSIGGKDSMSGTFQDISVPPTLLSFAVNTLNVEKVLSVSWKKAGNHLIYVPCEKKSNNLPDLDKYKKAINQVLRVHEHGAIRSACALGYGGLFGAVIKMALGNEMGARLWIPSQIDFFQKDYGGLLLEIDGDKNPEELFSSTLFYLLGKTQENKELLIKRERLDEEEEKIWEEESISLEEIRTRWERPLEEIFPQEVPQKDSFINSQEPPLVAEKKPLPRVEKPVVNLGTPQVVIPVFPGTNCEVDSLRAFEKAGAKGETLLIRHRRPVDLADSIEQLAQKIEKSQIVMLPGGFSGGDEPDGAAKFIAAIFRHPRVEKAVWDLMNKRDGLMLGICNGFQGLIKLGLLPYGEIQSTTKESPALTYNAIGRHQSTLVRTGVASTMSPWLWGLTPGEVYRIPVSHGEGRFICSQSLEEELNQKGQIATQYVDMEGNPSMKTQDNPNRSVAAIEGITSPDGRIFGKMGHIERVGSHLYQNVPGPQDMGIFRRGVNYFK